MLKVSELMQGKVFKPKRVRAQRTADEAIEVEHLTKDDLSLVGRVRQVVFASDGMRVVGLLVRRPDIAGMVKQPDAFVALDSFAVCAEGLVVTDLTQGMDRQAIDRLGLDWDACVLWTGMDAKTTDGKELGWVLDVAFDRQSGNVESFFIGDGGMSKALVGSVVVPAHLLRGYSDGYMLLAPEASHAALNGGLAAKAGESYARAKHEGKRAAQKAGEAANEAVQKGAYGLGRAIGEAKRTVKKQTDGEDSAKAVGKQLKKARGMFAGFMDEYKKASK